MIARILFISDLHKRWKDSASIKGQLTAQKLIQEDIIKFNKENGVTHNIILGDWYDRGFHGIGQAFSNMEMDRRLSESVNGNVYLCIGNHFYLERDENPEMYIIQPCDFIKPQQEMVMPTEPIFKCVPQLNIGPVQIDFFHFSKISKNYLAIRRDDCTFHIGVYHDDAVVPGWVREMEGYTGASSNTYMNDIYHNVDLAVHGHIHTKIGTTSLQLDNGRKVPMFIPGALGITANQEQYKNVEIQLPVIDINDDYTVSVKLANFSTHMEVLKFYDTKKKEKKVDVFEVKDQHVVTSETSLASLPVYLTKHGYQDVDLKLINSAMRNTLNLSMAVQIIAEVGNNYGNTE